MAAAVPATAPGGTARRLRIIARVHAMPPQHNAGAEHMLVAMLRPLVERGHDVAVWLSKYGRARAEYTYQGIRVVPLEARLDYGRAVQRADVVISHLECVPSTAALARGFGKPMVVICHNTHRASFRDAAVAGTALAVYNSRWMQAEAECFFAEYPTAIRPGAELVVRPPVVAADYATTPGDRVTLINCNEEKGGRVLAELARRMPDVDFLAVTGAYGQQILPDKIKNLEVLDHVPGEEMRERVYARTRILLMPSSYESWGRTGVEALASGIPVIAHPTPGLSEALAHGGVFVDRHDISGYEAVIRRLLDPGEWELASKRAWERSADLDPSAELAAWCAAVEALARGGGGR